MTRDKLRNIFQSSFSYENWQSVLVSLFSGVGKNCQLSLESTPQQMPVADDEKMDGFYIGEIRIGMESVKLYTFHIKDDRTNISRNRVGLRNTVNYLRDVNDAAIVVYYNDHQWRVSYICDIIRSLKRFSFVFGDQQTLYTTPIKRFENLSDSDISLDSILEAFSVEALSKDFFKNYKAQYDKFCSHIGNHIKSNRDYVKKMMGRLVFLQFLQKKGWLNGDYNFLQNLYANSEYKEDYLESVLEPLFFGVLNTKPEEREHIFKKNGWDLSLLKEWKRIQYLNGGLFEADNNDKKREHFDKGLFANLFDFFSQYNFTIDENDPYDAEVGIDPEMLGHIFENLLEDNKDKGAFYTPKEIVQYMCRQSLIEYLQSKLGKYTEIENFINHHDTGNRLDGKNYITANAKAIEELLDKVKICDPAIGSGAFPMGVLNEIFHAKMALDMTLDRAEVKKNIIQNSIYGVDIEQGAVDIARLRFWLSLVVDEDQPQPLPNLDYKIMCGNSLLSRFSLDTPINEVFAQYNKEHRTNFTLENYRHLVQQYTNTTSHDTKAEFRRVIEEIKRAFKTELVKGFLKRRKILKGKIDTLESHNIFGAPTKEALTQAKELRKTYDKMVQTEHCILTNKLYEDSFEWRFELPALLDNNGDFMGFDIVIGNPPYGAKFNATEKSIYRKIYPESQFKIDSYSLFILRSLHILNKGGYCSYIIPNTLLDNFFEEKVRAKLLVENKLTEINDLSDKIFSSAVVHSMILSYSKTTPKGDYGINVNSSDSLCENFDVIPSSFFIKQDKTTFTIRNFKSDGLIEKLNKHSLPLEEVLDIRQAIKSGDDKVYITNEKIDDNYFPILRGKDIHRYSQKNPNLFIFYGKHLACPRSKNIFEQPKILIREAGATITATIDENNFYIMSSLYNAISKSTNYTLKYILALINSKLFQFLMNKLTFEKTKGAFTKAKIFHYYRLPVKILSRKEQQPFIDLVDNILEAKRLDPTADTTALEAQIDQMVYALYNLTEEEITLIEK